MTKTKEYTPRRAPTLRRAFSLLDQSLEQNAPVDYSERIELFGRQHFGELWDLRHTKQNQTQST
jgi:hypothetical protein